MEVKGLNVAFREDRVIRDLNFNLKEKENLVIVGPNGAGKSVLLRALLNTVPHKGDVIWRKGIKIGYVPQRFLPDRDLPLSVEEFFDFKKLSIDKVHQALCSVGLHGPSILKKKIGVISSGQLQRIMIAWVMIDDPDVLLFDEPTAGIDIEGEETVYNLLAKLEKEKDLTMILITHDLNVVYKFADSVLCLNKKLVCYGTPQEALNPESLNELYGGDVKVYKHAHKHGN